MMAIAYLRVSTDEQHAGLEAQRAAIASWAACIGAELVGEHVDHGVSGGADIDNRPGMLAALSAVHDLGRGAVLIVAKRDRLARDVVIAATLERLVMRSGGVIASADGVGVGDGPEAVLVRTFMDAIAQYERAIIGMRTRAALAVRRARGHATSHAPFGQRAGERLEGSGKPLKPDGDESATVEQVLELVSAGLSLRDVVAELERAGVVGRTGRPLQLTQVARIVKRAGG